MNSIPKLLKIKDYVTLIGTTLGIIALIFAAIGSRFFISFGFFLITISLGTDLLDGYIARKTGTVNKFGIELDSLSDSLTFGIAPAVLIFQAFRRGQLYDFFLMVCCIFFALAAILRLARFNITTESELGYTGVPTPMSCLTMITFFYANYFLAFGLGGITYPFPDISYLLIPFILILVGWFNITTYIKFGKKGKYVYIVVLILSPLAPIFGIIGLMAPNFEISVGISIFFFLSFFLLMVYFILGFFLKPEKKLDNTS